MALRATKGYENAARSLVGSILCAASSRERFPARSVLLLFTFLAICVADDGANFHEAVVAFQRGDFVAAEQQARAALATRPNDAPLLSLLGAALDNQPDNQQKLKEADESHRRAVATAPGSVDVWNNYGNHLLRTGDDEGARQAYLKVAALSPANVNAAVQLARLALQRKAGAEALLYLQRLPANQQAVLNIAVLRLEALYLAGNSAAAAALLSQLAPAAQTDAGLGFAMGLALANAGQYEPAESYFTRVLAGTPTDFNVLYNLGIAAGLAHHYERAREVLETARTQQPRNVEMLIRLAVVYRELQQTEAAVRLLVQAAGLAPQRADVQRLLAVTTADLGALPDAVAAWDRYLKLEPKDDTARRERGFTAMRMGQVAAGVADLSWYVARHPDDPVGYYELGVAERETDPAQGLAHLDKAVSLKSDFVAARSARGSVYYQLGQPEAALKDLEPAASLRPDDALTLDRLGQTYLALDRPAEAVRVLRKAAELAPDDSKTQLHLARALADAGQAGESKVAMDRFRQFGPAAKAGVPAGLVDFLSLTPEQQHADYRARVQKTVGQHPEDAAAQVAWLKLLLEDGKTQEAAATARRIAGLKPGPAVAADAGRALLDCRQFAPAEELLQLAAAAGASTDVKPDLALARAQRLEAGGSPNEAAAVLETTSGAPSQRPDWYRQAAALLIASGKAAEALKLVDQALRILPGNRELLLAKAMVLELGGLELSGRAGDAEPLLRGLQARWPEWHPAWVADGIILAAHQKSAEARQALETAMALGARSPEIRTALTAGDARLLLHRLFQQKPPREW
jgi:tetratricopeptide (TPR) repeat protein